MTAVSPLILALVAGIGVFGALAACLTRKPFLNVLRAEVPCLSLQRRRTWARIGRGGDGSHPFDVFFFAASQRRTPVTYLVGTYINTSGKIITHSATSDVSQLSIPPYPGYRQTVHSGESDTLGRT